MLYNLLVLFISHADIFQRIFLVFFPNYLRGMVPTRRTNLLKKMDALKRAAGELKCKIIWKLQSAWCLIEVALHDIWWLQNSILIRIL